jgi:hypothetical protein
MRVSGHPNWATVLAQYSSANGERSPRGSLSSFDPLTEPRCECGAFPIAFPGYRCRVRLREPHSRNHRVWTRWFLLAWDSAPPRSDSAGLFLPVPEGTASSICRSPCAAVPLLFFEPEIDHFVMAITAAEATVRHTTLPSSGLSYRNVWTADMCTWLCIGAACAGFFAGGLVVLLAARLPTDKHTAL